MEPEINAPKGHLAPLKKVTPLSKYLAMALFVVLPFVGGFIGYNLAPEKVVEIERVVEKEVVINKNDTVAEPSIVRTTTSQEVYSSPSGFSILLPIGVDIVEQPAQFSYSSVTKFTGDFGSICISPDYGCGGQGAEGAKIDAATLTTEDGTEMNITIFRSNDDDSVVMAVHSLKPIPVGFTDSAQIQVFTNEENLSLAESVLKSINFLE